VIATSALQDIRPDKLRATNFPKRMYGYNTRIADRYNRTVVSLAVLADDDPEWRPDHYAEGLWGWSVRMSWPPLAAEKYVTLNRTVATATTLDEVRRACAKAAAPARRPRKGGNGKRGSTKT
jgi:hypothetical protein